MRFAVWQGVLVANGFNGLKSPLFDVRLELLFVFEGSEVANYIENEKLVLDVLVVLVKTLEKPWIPEKLS